METKHMAMALGFLMLLAGALAATVAIPGGAAITPSPVDYLGNVTCSAAPVGNYSNYSTSYYFYKNLVLLNYTTMTVSNNTTGSFTLANLSNYYGDYLICQVVACDLLGNCAAADSAGAYIVQSANTVPIVPLSSVLIVWFDQWGALFMTLLAIGSCYFMHVNTTNTLYGLGVVWFACFAAGLGDFLILMAIAAVVIATLMKQSGTQ